MGFINKIRILIYRKFHSGNQRTILAQKAIARMFINKGASIILSMLYVPLFLSCLDTTRYGIWVTIMSFVNWLGFFDIGIGQGMRNLLAKSVAEGDYFNSRKIISTAYIAIATIFLSIIIIFTILYPYINWYKIVNAPDNMRNEINLIIFISIVLICFNFIFNLFKSILFALQKPQVTSNIALWSQAASLLVIYIFYLIGQIKSLVPIGTILLTIPIIVILVYTICYFKNEFKLMSPSIRFFDKNFIKSILSLGGSFFIIQIANLVLFQSNNLIISNIINPNAVSEYYVVNKYTSLLFLAFSIVTTPFWSATTEAYTKKDFVWISETKNRLLKIFGLFVVMGLIMICISPLFFKLWIGNKIKIEIITVILLTIYYLLQMFSNIYLSFINGIGKIKLQLLTTLFLAAIYIPISIFSGKALGILGIIISGIIVLCIPCIVYPIQYYKLMYPHSNTSKSIWYE